MKAIKKTYENLEKVCDSIVRVPYSQGKFVSYPNRVNNSICLFAFGRDGIGSTILSKIPSNYCFHLTFEDDGLRLSIWFD